MNTFWKTITWQQFGAAIDMFENALTTCPDELWREYLWDSPPEWSGFTEFWYIAYHTMFWLDLYLSGSVEGFVPPTPFTLDELNPDGVLPARPYTKAELQTYLQHCRQKCQTTITALTDDKVRQRCKFPWGEVSFAELLLYNMRHVQEHAAQLNLLLGQKSGAASGWVTEAQNSSSD